nr:hypothetical protein CFP56_41924 [Quercus suber]
MFEVQSLGERKLGCMTQTSEDRERDTEDYQEKGLVNTIEELPKESVTILVKESMDRKQTNTVIEGSEQGEMETNQTETPKFKFELAPKMHEDGGHVSLDLTKDREGPMAMTYDMELGWVAKTLAPTSGHWKRKAHAGQTKGKEKAGSDDVENETKRVSGVADAARQHCRAL